MLSAMPTMTIKTRMKAATNPVAAIATPVDLVFSVVDSATSLKMLGRA